MFCVLLSIFLRLLLNEGNKVVVKETAVKSEAVGSVPEVVQLFEDHEFLDSETTLLFVEKPGNMLQVREWVKVSMANGKFDRDF